MGKKTDYGDKRTERAYTGPVCAVPMDRANADGDRICGAHAYRTINDLPMCDAHAAIERRRGETIRGVQDRAITWLLAREIIDSSMDANQRAMACRAFLCEFIRRKNGNLQMRAADDIARDLMDKASRYDSAPF
jgi:hypothetical protein